MNLVDSKLIRIVKMNNNKRIKINLKKSSKTAVNNNGKINHNSKVLMNWTNFNS